ncbi:MAG: dienelactone hydrolase family protein [Planctomycetes bacterium]|nr:dienelactone hydrolase family protein [Planctomycetota bacterium]
MNSPSLLLPCLLPWLLGALPAQVDRYELGLRLRAFERRLGAAADGPERHAALGELNRAVQAFFSLDTAAVARAIAAAERALDGGAEDPLRTVADSVQLILDRRLVDAAQPTLPLRLGAAYPIETGWPADLHLEVRLPGDRTPRLDVAVPAVPVTLELPLAAAAPGDQQLEWTLRQGERRLPWRRHGLSLAKAPGPRLERLLAAADAAAAAPRTIETTTLPSLAKMLRTMTLSRREETILPGSRLLDDAEALAAAIAAGSRWHGSDRPGEHWLRLPLGAGASSVRLLAPAVPPGERRPLVLALHGAGGSENLFFDGYGDGAIIAACRQRGWFLVAPRNEMLGGGGDLIALLEAMAERWPIDRDRVLLVGHSMGAAQAVAVAGKHPTRFAAAAALGGGGNPGRAAAIAELPWFVGVGERDFARSQAQALRQKLQGAGAQVEFHEYPSLEHLAIVQFALGDVFAAFDRALAARAAARK